MLMSLVSPAFAGTIGGVATPKGQSHTLYSVNCPHLNVRQDPSMNNKPIAQVHLGDTLQVLSIENGWAKIFWNNSYAYVYAGYISRMSKFIKSSAAVSERNDALGEVATMPQSDIPTPPPESDIPTPPPQSAMPTATSGLSLPIQGTAVPGATLTFYFVQTDGSAASANYTVDPSGVINIDSQAYYEIVADAYGSANSFDFSFIAITQTEAGKTESDRLVLHGTP